MTAIKDLHGNRLTISANGITSSNPSVPGSSITFTRDGQNRITKSTDPGSNYVSYGYDASGDLRSVTDRENSTTSFTYEPTFPHHLQSIVDPLGRTPIRNDYFDDGRIKSHTDAFGKTITYVHDLSGRQEVVTNRNGEVRVLFYDDRGNVTKEIQPDSKQVLRTFDARNNRLSETEPHDPSNLSPPKTSWAYDAADNVTSTTDAENHTTSQSYNARKQVLTSTDARGKTTTNVYDATGNLLSTTDAANNVTSYSYDPQGNVLNQTVCRRRQAMATPAAT